MKRLLYVLLTLAWATPVAAQTTTFAIPADSLMAPVVLFPASAVNGAGQINVPLVGSGGGAVTIGGITSAENINAAVTKNIGFTGRAFFGSPADGIFTINNNALTIGSELKIDALPTVASGFGTSPSITAGSTPFAGSINVGTGGVAVAGTLNFNGTAFPSAPFCTVSTATTNAVTRASPSTTQLALNSTTAWTASDIVSWVCVSAK